MKKHGLRRSGTAYVLTDESEVETKLKRGSVTSGWSTPGSASVRPSKPSWTPG